MRRAKTNFFSVLLLALLLIGGALVLKHGSAPYPKEDKMPVEERDINTCDYFNGKIQQVTEEYLYVEPIEDWEWQTVSRVKLPLNSVNNFDPSEWKAGDIIRVPYNSTSMEWSEDEVFIGTIFYIYNISDEVE